MTYSLRGSYTRGKHSTGWHLPQQPRQLSRVSMTRSKSCMPKIRPRSKLLVDLLARLSMGTAQVSPSWDHGPLSFLVRRVRTCIRLWAAYGSGWVCPPARAAGAWASDVLRIAASRCLAQLSIISWSHRQERPSLVRFGARIGVVPAVIGLE